MVRLGVLLSTSFHDALYLRRLLGLERAPEFEQRLQKMGITDAQVRLQPVAPGHPLSGYEKLKTLQPTV
jgi:ethanolamine ammonia-lyase large subunit